MTETEYQMAVQRTHDAYCKTVIRHAAITAIRRLQRKWEREISLEYLMYEKHFPITDWRDFVTAELDEERLLTACGQTAVLYHAELAAARDAGSSSWMKPPAPRTQPTPMPSRAACCATRP